MNHFLTQHITYPLHERLKGQDTVAAFRRIQGKDHWSLDQFHAHQVQEAKKIFALAYERSTFYRSNFDRAGVSPADLGSLADLRRFPTMCKDDLRNEREGMITLAADERHKLVPFSSGGSTGNPVVFFVDRGRIAGEWAACWRARSWWGLDWGDKWFWLWGSSIELSAKDTVKARLKAFRDWTLNRRLFSSFNMSEERMQHYADLIRRERPRYLYAYSSAAFIFAEFILKRGIDLSKCGMRVVYTTADMLYPHMRVALTKAFHCPVASEYGSRDCGFTGHECLSGGLHLHADRLIVEVLRGNDPAPDGEMGEIVITVLDATAQPFIRYRTGDIGSLDPNPCSCGITLPLLKTLEGRSADFLLGAGNRLMHEQVVTYQLRSLDGIKFFRIIQDELETLTIEIVKNSPEVRLPEEKLTHGIQTGFGMPIRVIFKYVDRIEPLPSGKYRYVISKLTGRYFDPR